ncbi:MAG: GIY-YIG nuclease family protein [Candidatus Falkowbacteria bacterium]|nr:GIY-YIG nuclease family protein [Candidatus Falkowbacteria bacterium]
MYYVYALYNERNNKIYIGQTCDLEKRLILHNSKIIKKSYTFRFNGSWDIVYKEEVKDRTSALTREKQLKSYQGRIFIKNLIHSRVAQR